MTAIINVPPSLDDEKFELVLDQVARVPAEEKLLLDARHAKWSSPYGLTALLTLGQSRAEKPAFTGPEDENTASYWSRAAFYRHAEEVFDLHGFVPRPKPAGDSDVLLEITPVTRSDDVHAVVERIQDKAKQILTNSLHLDPKATMGFAMTLSESCQNIVEHAGQGGWVAVQKYSWKKRLGRNVVVIAVCDAGQGFRRSLETSQGRRIAERWDDATALEEAVLKGTSRFREAGRGQGLKGVRRYVSRWGGRLSIRSGTARITMGEGDLVAEVPLEEELAPFPGAQVQIVIPEHVEK
ncbi:MAG: ATP-binding protein [Gemmatimonadaceae bacterium]|nr:ATP-binding protein [Gemmatimonadaceae bacterium]